MHVAVLIKQVPGTTSARLNPETGTMIREASDTVMNPLDEHALYAAVQIKKTRPGTKVTALSMGPGSAQKVLQEAAARGADQGVLLSHRAFAGSDTIATARVLAAALRKLGPVDLILAGEKSTDGETGQTGPMTATLLNFPVITFVRRLSVGDGFVRAERLVENGVEEVELGLPALVTVVRDINNPPPLSMREIIRAKKLIFPVWGPADLEIEEGSVGLKGSATRVVKVFSPKFARNTTFYRAEDGDKAIGAVLDVLQKRNLI
ncbi:MAG: electron transfer flavoprotein subunit beta/FixA family protein [Bacillota bacterium]